MIFQMQALIVIDVQQGMFENSVTPPVFDGKRVVHRIQSLITAARTAGIPVIFVQHCAGEGHPLQEGTPGWEIHPSIAPASGEVIVKKKTPDSFLNTQLEEALIEHHVSDLILCGMRTEYSIDTTCRRAFSLGYRAVLVSDAHTTRASEALAAADMIAHHNLVLSNCFATLKTTDQVCSDLARQGP